MRAGAAPLGTAILDGRETLASLEARVASGEIDPRPVSGPPGAARERREPGHLGRRPGSASRVRPRADARLADDATSSGSTSRPPRRRPSSSTRPARSRASAPPSTATRSRSPLWSEQDPHLWWDGAIAAIRSVLASTGVAGRDVAADRADRPDARPRAARRRGRGPPAGDPLERPADRRGVRRDPGGRRPGAADRDHRQRRADRVHRAEARLGPRSRAGHLGAGRPRPAAEGLRPAAADRRPRDRQGRRRRDDPVRPGRPRLVGRDRRRARDRPRLAAARRSRDRRSPAPSRRPPPTQPASGRHAGRRGRRRPGRERRRASAPSSPGRRPCPSGRPA